MRIYKHGDLTDHPRLRFLFIQTMRDNVYGKEVAAAEPISETYLEGAERTNGQLAMIGVIAALGAYLTTGQIIPGIF